MASAEKGNLRRYGTRPWYISAFFEKSAKNERLSSSPAVAPPVEGYCCSGSAIVSRIRECVRRGGKAADARVEKKT